MSARLLVGDAAAVLGTLEAGSVPFHDDGHARVYHGDALECLREMPTGSVDSVVSDPPYACVDRKYGRLSEADWFALMEPVVLECRRILKPQGSAVFVLQPNFEKHGSMRLWLWKFMVWAGEEWNLVQDAYWWNFTAMPGAGVQRTVGLLRASVKTCVWLGPADCYRNQDAVTWTESDSNRAQRLAYRAGEDPSGLQPSGHSRDRGKMAGTAAARVDPSGREKNWESITRQRDLYPSGGTREKNIETMRGNCSIQRGNSGGQNYPSGWSKDDGKIADAFNGRGAVTPFNLLPIANSDSSCSGGAYGHGAATPLDLCRWWVRYLTPKGGTVLDPFVGTGTVLLAARAEGCLGIGIEKDRHSCAAAVERLKNGLTPPGKARGQAQLEFAP